MNSFYTGTPLEFGDTSIANTPSKSIQTLFHHLYKEKGRKIVLDYGAGKYARIANFLRKELNMSVFAYDPYNYNIDHNEWKAWEDGCVSNTIPPFKFDLAFTSYVLNVVPKHIEREIIEATESYSDHVIHIVRNMVIVDMVKRNLGKQNIVTDFIKNEYGGPTATDEDILKLCEYGVQTPRGFQRVTHLEEYGYKLIQRKHGYKYYEKNKNS